MGDNVVFFAWNRPVPGREQLSAAHFQDFLQYLGGLQQSGAIQSFDVAFLNNHGGDMNGFFLIKGEPAQISALVTSADWMQHMTRASMHLDGSGAVTGAIGDLVMERMALWTGMIPG